MLLPKFPRRLTRFSAPALLLPLTLVGLLWCAPEMRRAHASYFAGFVVTNTQDSGAGSLRQAILDANANPGPDDITFNIPGAGVHTVKPLSPLPVVTDTVNIDGYMQPGSAANSIMGGSNAVILVELDGSAAGVGASGLEITGNTVNVSGLVINRFGGHGIFYSAGGEGTVAGCYVGTNAAGTAALGNGGHGVAIVNSGSHLIGGAAAGDSNIIAGNGGDGVHIEEIAGGDADVNVVQGDRIGVGSGGGALPNAGNGVYVFGDQNTVGGENAGEGSEIANNSSDGVEVASGVSNSVRGNSVYANAGLGIELRDGQPDGTVTPNDSFDGDDGANRLQNFPLIDSATRTVNGTDIAGTLDSLPGVGFRIDFYSSPSCDPSGNGEGQTYLGSKTVGTLDDGHSNFSLSLPALTTVGHFVTATATSEDQNTSEFSPCVLVTAPTVTWDGSDDTNWHNGANWDTGTVPTATDNALIPSGAINNEPAISTADAAAAGVTVQAGRTLTVGGGRTLDAAATNVNGGAFLNVPANQTGTLKGTLTLDGSLTGVNSASVFRFDGAALTDNGSISVAVLRFGGTAQTFAGAGAVTSQTTEVLSGATVTLGANRTLGALTVLGGGTFSQGAGFNLTLLGKLTVTAGGTLQNLGTGDLTLGGDVLNDGVVNLNGGGAACGDADAILIRSTDAATQRAWSGAGTFSLSDVDVNSQAGTAQVTVRSGTNSGNNGPNWIFSVCPAGTTLTVNSTDDGNDGACNAAHCSLREAILTANSTPGQFETIAFQIGGGGPQTISPTSALPAVTDPVNIDGTTQPGFGGSPIVELNGASAGASAGLNITSGGSTVRGLVVNGFGADGIRLSSGGGNTVVGNYIGTNVAGTSARANGGSGLLIDNAPNNNVGGTTAAERNLISGNNVGVLVSGVGANSNLIRGNFVGTRADGTSALPNVTGGIVIANGAGGNFVGGTGAAAGNLIAFNGGDGVAISSGTGNRVLSNSIHTNGTTAQHLGIDLGPDGVAPNDAGDADAGANNLQNSPVINSAASNGVTTAVSGALNSTGSTTFRVEFFSNPSCDAGGAGEGTQLLGAADVLTDAGGNASFNVALANVAVGQVLTATATDPAGNTSEFSACVGVVAATYSLSGRVTDAGAQAVAGVNVHLSGSATADATTDAAGNYAFGGLPQGGNFVLTPSKTGYGFAPPSRAVNNLQSDQANLDFTGALNTYTVTGTVVDGGGTALAGVNVHLSGSAVGDVLTDALGNYSFAGLTHGGSFTLTPSKNGYSFNPPSRTVSNLQGDQANLDFNGLLNTYIVTGRVTDEGGQAIVGVNVHLSGSATGDTTTDASGNYAFGGLQHGGNFTLTPAETNYRFTPPSRAVNDLQAAQTGLDFTGGLFDYTVAGRVTDAGGAGLAGVTVTLAGSGSAVTRTDAGGNYKFEGVPAGGTFVVTPEREGFSFNPPNQVITDIGADVGFNTAVGPQPTPTPDPSDDFGGGPDPNPNRWVKGILTNPPAAFDPLVNIFQQDGLLHIQPRADANGSTFGGLVSARALDLNSSPVVSVEVVQAAQGEGAQTIFGLGADAQNWVRFVVQNGPAAPPAWGASEQARSESDSVDQALIFQLSLGADKFQASVTYDPAQQRFWRFRFDAAGRLVIFETSPDFVNWTERFRARLPADQTALIAELSAGTTRATSNPGEALFDNFLVSPSPRVQFETSAFSARESDGAARVNVVRTGSDESPLSVSYSTGGGTATAGSDYAAVSGTLLFARGERLKSFTIPLFNDDLTEGSETVGVTLSNPSGGRLGAVAQAAVTILDDESENPINDTTFFVRQHYLDFLGREPDAEGLQFWVDNIRSCGGDLQCREVKRVNVSAAFFLSIEFQGTGYFVHRIYRLSYGRAPTFAEYLPDLTAVRESVVVGRPGALDRLELNKRLFVEQFAGRAAFKAKYDPLNEAQYVDTLAAGAGVSLAEEERTALIVGLLTRRETRGGVLLKMVEKDAFVRAEFNRAFVQMQYFGYLRRDPDAAGFNFWLSKLDDFNGDYIRAEMVKAFLESIEYRSRFGRP